MQRRRIHLSWEFIAALFLLLSGATAALLLSTPAIDPQLEPIKPGDALNITVYSVVGPGVETTKLCRVDQKGAVSMPMIGRVYVNGLTCDEAVTRIKRAYSASCCCGVGEFKVAHAGPTTRPAAWVFFPHK